LILYSIRSLTFYYSFFPFSLFSHALPTSSIKSPPLLIFSCTYIRLLNVIISLSPTT
jgi:hypothetical protein